MKPRRDSRYLQWIRTLPCAVCRTTRNIEAAHTGAHGLGQKAPDSTAIPLCVTHHRTANDCYHKLGPRKFADVHKLNIAGIVARAECQARHRVISGTSVGSFHRERYMLGSIWTGISRAARKMIDAPAAIQDDTN